MLAPTPPLSVMIVDDTKFSSAVVRKILHAEGYNDVRVANSAHDALTALNQRNADILIADWLMPGMDGLQLTQQVRQLNQQVRTFTYIILLTAKEEVEDLRHAFTFGIDDFVGKTKLKTTLLPRVNAAQRITQAHKSLLEREASLARQLVSLESACNINMDTGTGNTRYLELQLTRALEQLGSRGGQLCLALCQIETTAGAPALTAEILEQTSTRLRQTARPLDTIARITDSVFAVLMYSDQPDFNVDYLQRRLQQRLFAQPLKLKQGNVRLTGKLQLTLINADQAKAYSAQPMLSRALHELYQRKANAVDESA